MHARPLCGAAALCSLRDMLSASRRTRLLRQTAAVVALVTGLTGLGAGPASSSGAPGLLLNFDQGDPLGIGGRVADSSGYSSDGGVVAHWGGSLVSAPGAAGTRAARYPAPCVNEPCPNTAIVVADAANLDPGRADFEWGADILLTSSESSSGQNVMQKGLFSDPGGQWKLQVDGHLERPSCVLSGRLADGTFSRAFVIADIAVSTGTWRRVACRRTRSSLSVYVDGQLHGRTLSQALLITSTAPLTIGAKFVDRRDNDQFQGSLDNVYMTR